MTTGLADFFHYNLWANLRLLDTCASLSDAQLDTTMIGVHGSVRETILHILSAEEGYAMDLTGASPTPLLEELTTFPGFDELRRRAEKSGKELITFAEQEDPGQVLNLPENYKAQGVIVLLQALNHGIDHRSQIATLLSQQSIALPRLDGWGYNNAMR